MPAGIRMIKSVLDSDETVETGPSTPPPNGAGSLFALADDAASTPASERPAEPDYDSSDWDAPFEPRENEPSIIIAPYKAPSKVETIRRSGLAWSAGVIFFGSVVFTMIIGWFADLLLGTSPWGLVAGIILGSVIAFVNFFRIAGQIFKNN